MADPASAAGILCLYACCTVVRWLCPIAKAPQPMGPSPTLVWNITSRNSVTSVLSLALNGRELSRDISDLEGRHGRAATHGSGAKENAASLPRGSGSPWADDLGSGLTMLGQWLSARAAPIGASWLRSKLVPEIRQVLSEYFTRDLLFLRCHFRPPTPRRPAWL